jgi:hypothetical protein
MYLYSIQLVSLNLIVRYNELENFVRVKARQNGQSNMIPFVDNNTINDYSKTSVPENMNQVHPGIFYLQKTLFFSASNSY